MATLKAWRRSMKRTLPWSIVCEFMCVEGSQNEWEIGHLSDLEVSNKETKLKIEFYTKFSPLDPIENFSPLDKVNSKSQQN